MPAYLIARVDVRDAARYRDYAAHTPRCVAAFGGRFIVRNGERVVLEGPPDPRRIVVIEFPSMDLLRRFYASPEYTRVKALRAGAGDAEMIAIEGFSGAAWAEALAASSKLSV